MNVVLIGLMGSGKTTLGLRLAELMNYTFVDTDHLIESSQGETISSLFENRGEHSFRLIEQETLAKLSQNHSQVISTGGGIVVSKANRDLLPSIGRVYWLNPTLDALSKRLKGDTTRPLLKDGNIRSKLEVLMKDRGAYYAECADSIIDTSDETKIESIANDILKDFEAHYDSKR